MFDNSMALTATIWAFSESIVIFAGFIGFVYKIFKRLDRIEYQLYNNGGESMKDTVDRIETELLILKTKLGE